MTRARAALLQALLSLLALALAGCALLGPGARTPTVEQITPLLSADLILLGEQHDSADHQRIERELVQALIARGQLAALALEMAPQGGNTAGLPRDAGEDEVRSALRWVEKDWPWATYGPVAMIAVRAGVPVLGANLPAAQRGAAREQRELDLLLPGPALKAQQQNIRLGHCGMLPENQIGPMTRIQIARDQSMAQTLMQSREKAKAGKVVLLLAGAQHVDRSQGVPLHLNGALKAITIGLIAPNEIDSTRLPAKFDALWPAEPAPEKDYCAEFKQHRQTGQ